MHVQIRTFLSDGGLSCTLSGQTLSTPCWCSWVRVGPCELYALSLTSSRPLQLWSAAFIALTFSHLYMQDTPLNPQKSDSPYTTNFKYQNNNIQHAPRSQRLSSTKNPESTSECYFLVIPGESLTHITTYVDDPSSLFALSRVNRRLRDHVADDNTWYRVFAFHFLGIGPESDPKEETKLLLRRTENTWKREFIQRFNVIR